MKKEGEHGDVRERFYRRERRSVPAAREFAREALEEWDFGSRADEVLLCV
ncbi:ATP-binding protein, partial [Streptomyces sp. PRB2-1]|nr:ATP-binding protein [Actinacidiphila epipremni]